MINKSDKWAKVKERAVSKNSRSSAFFDGGRDGKTPAAKIAWLELALKHQDSNCVYCYLDRSVQFSVFFNLHLI
jgi:hypothetical protein